MNINNVPVIEKYTNSDRSIEIEPIMYQNDLLLPISGRGIHPMYLRIPGKLIKDIVDANTPHVNKVKR